MTDYKYTTQLDGARAVGRDLSISVKHSIEICNFIRGKNVSAVKQFLRDVADKKQAVPYKRFNRDLGHKAGMAAGRYPVKASLALLKLVESVEANAQFKGMNVDTLQIVHAAVQKASTPMHGGRQRGRVMKRAHVELMVQEVEEKKSAKKRAAKQEKKADAEPVKKKVAKKEDAVTAEEKKEETVAEAKPTNDQTQEAETKLDNQEDKKKESEVSAQ